MKFTNCILVSWNYFPFYICLFNLFLRFFISFISYDNVVATCPPFYIFQFICSVSSCHQWISLWEKEENYTCQKYQLFLAIMILISNGRICIQQHIPLRTKYSSKEGLMTDYVDFLNHPLMGNTRSVGCPIYMWRTLKSEK